jgi:hypothetical protein
VTKTSAVKELRRVVRRLAAYPMLKTCVSDTCGEKKRARDKCIFCDADLVLKQSSKAL